MAENDGVAGGDDLVDDDGAAEGEGRVHARLEDLLDFGYSVDPQPAAGPGVAADQQLVVDAHVLRVHGRRLVQHRRVGLVPAQDEVRRRDGNGDAGGGRQPQKATSQLRIAVQEQQHLTVLQIAVRIQREHAVANPQPRHRHRQPGGQLHTRVAGETSHRLGRVLRFCKQQKANVNVYSLPLVWARCHIE